MQSTAILVLVASCFIVLATSEMQSAHNASSKFGASLAPMSKQQQQQQNHQQPQQLLSSRLSHISTDQKTVGGQRTPNASHYHSTALNRPTSHMLDADIPSHTLLDDVSLRLSSDSDGGVVKASNTEESPYRITNLRNDLENFIHAPIKSVWGKWELPYKTQFFNNKYISGDITLSPGSGIESRMFQHKNHRVDKREATSTFSASDGQTESDFIDEEYPIYLDRRYQVFMPSNAPYSAPYMSAQEFKETFRRSDPYFMGKRSNDILSDADIQFPGDRRAAPKFVGRRDPPYFVGKRESPAVLESYLASLVSEDDGSSLLEDKRAAPKFVGRRGAPYFVGKRGPPKFVGKRDSAFELDDDSFFPLEDKRAAPKFVGRRGSPYFVGKRESSDFAGKSWNELSAENELAWLLETKKGAPKFVGRRGAPYFVGKRGSPMFIGKRSTLFDFGDDESPLLSEKSEVLNYLSRRGSPYFVGKRGPPKFVGKRWANPDLQDQALSLTEAKRRAPKFIGRRGSPYFVGKREPLQFVGKRWNGFSLLEETHPHSGDKKAVPKFIGRRGSPFFVGKRKPPMFIGKRVSNLDVTEPELNILENKRGPPKFVGRRGAPYFVGKRAAPKFIGKRRLDLLGDDINKVILRNEATDIEQDTSEFLKQLLEEKALSENKSFLTEVKVDASSDPQDLKNLNRMQSIENVNSNVQEQNTAQIATNVGRTINEQFQKDTVEDTEELR